MFKNFINAFKVKEIRNKILLTILLVLIYRLGCWIPVPGVDASAFANQVSGDEGFLGLLSSVSGGALANGSLLALGIAPYISASIIIQLLTIAVPSLERLSKMGDEGRKKIAGYTKIAALVLAIAQAVAIVISFEGVLKESTLGDGFILPTWFVGIVVTLVLIAGSMFTYWLGEKITELGISNGQSILIFVGILSTAGTSLLTNFTNIFNGDMGSLTELLLFVLALILIFGFIVWIDGSERKVPVQYAKQIKGRKMYGGQSTFIPIRVNATGVMPIIFASSLMQFPVIIAQLFGKSFEWTKYLSQSYWCKISMPKYSIGLLVYIILVVLFAYFYTSITFNPLQIADNLKRAGGVIPGITPGRSTTEYLNNILNKIVFIGSVGLLIVALIPVMCTGFFGASVSFGGTSVIIIVGVVLETLKQIEAMQVNRNYKGFLSE